MKKLDEEKDLELLMVFRNFYWDEWVEFLSDEGYEPLEN